MVDALLTRVKSKLFIYSQRRSLNVLEGEYKSLAFGRSTDFEDLREYEPGDDIKDIDWKATARSNSPLVRRYIASRRHTVLLVADTGINMQAIGASHEPKHSLATLALGVLGYLGVKHTDSVAAVYGDSDNTLSISAKATESHVERILQAIHYQSVKTDNAASNIMHQLEYVAMHFPQRMIILVAADEFEVTEKNLETLRILKTKHDLMWVSIADADPLDALSLNTPVFDVLDGYEIPDFIKGDKELITEFADAENQRKQEMQLALDGLRIPQISLFSSEETIGKLIVLLERRRKQRGL